MTFPVRERFRESKVQLEEIDRETRNSIWNEFLLFLACIREEDSSSTSINYKGMKYNFFLHLWRFYFKEPIDEFPIKR